MMATTKKPRSPARTWDRLRLLHPARATKTTDAPINAEHQAAQFLARILRALAAHIAADPRAFREASIGMIVMEVICPDALRPDDSLPTGACEVIVAAAQAFLEEQMVYHALERLGAQLRAGGEGEAT